MTAAVGRPVPDAPVMLMDSDQPITVSSTELLGRGKVVLFAVPGAFTPVCSEQHLPGFVLRAQEIRDKGVDTIACISVNDPYVMRAWGEQHGAGDAVVMLADPEAAFTRAMGMATDASASGLGERSRRYAAVIEDGTITAFDVEARTVDHEVSTAHALLARL
jgi:glutaredoxin/glutathione-dependent peroxiredoxin